MEDVPVYIVTGFLESGKTKFMTEMLTDDSFSEGERTLLLVCEEGIEEYDEDMLKQTNTILRVLDDPEDMQGKFIALDKEFKPERVMIEYNSVWGLEALYDAPKPEAWQLGQIITLVDATTFENYMTNMQKIIADGLAQGDLIMFNRCDDSTPKSNFRRRVLALNNSARIVFENSDGTMDDGVSDEDLPFDVSADPIVISDELFGIWYLDAMEHPERYDGKNISMKGRAFYMPKLPKKCIVFGRHAMTCCAADIGGIGYVCKCTGKMPNKNAWIQATLHAEKGYSQLHERDAIILVMDAYESAQPPKEEVVTFNTPAQ